MESHESRNSEDQQIIRDSRSEVMQLRASAVPPNLTRDLEAKIESQKYEIQSLQRDLLTTQDSLNSWDEVKLGITEPAVSHPPHAGSDSELFPQKREYNAESSFIIGCSSQYTTGENLENDSGSTHFFSSRRLLYRLTLLIHQ